MYWTVRALYSQFSTIKCGVVCCQLIRYIDIYSLLLFFLTASYSSTPQPSPAVPDKYDVAEQALQYKWNKYFGGKVFTLKVRLHSCKSWQSVKFKNDDIWLTGLSINWTKTGTIAVALSVTIFYTFVQ